MQTPSLFGLKNTNRDFTHKESWGKNQFNSSFPAALACFMSKKGISPIYLVLNNNLEVAHSSISIESLFGLSPDNDNLFFAFESDYAPFRQFVIGNLPRIDLVTQDKRQQNCLKGLEIKLTALPDHTTCNLSDDKFGTEIVIRPDSIVYLALSIATLYRDKIQNLETILGTHFDTIQDWTEGNIVMPYIPMMIQKIDEILVNNIVLQEPFIMQPIWKTVGKSSKLAENCLDMFIWSNFAFTRLFLNSAKSEWQNENKITRPLRSIIWLFKMLYDYSKTQKINHSQILDALSYNTKNDKAFAISGKISHSFMTCSALTKPRITQKDIKGIILGNGHLLLSPERRFDAIIYNSPDLF